MSIVCDKLHQGLGRGAAQGRSLPPLLWREGDQEGAARPFFLNLCPSSVSEFGTPCFPLSFIHSVEWEVTARPVGNLLRDRCSASVERSQHHQRKLLFSFGFLPRGVSSWLLFYKHVCHMERSLICLKAFPYTLPIDQDTDGTEVIPIKKRGPLLKKLLKGTIFISLNVYVLFNFLLIVQ